MSRDERSTSRRQFLAGIAGLAGAFTLDPAALGRLANSRTPRRPAQAADADSALPANPSTRTLPAAYEVPGLNHLAWVWQFTHDGSKEEIARVLAEHDLGVALKTHDGIEWMAEYDGSPDAVSGPSKVAELARFFEDRGVPFHAWCVLTGEDPRLEAEMAADVLAAGARTISLDLEAHAGFWRGSSLDAIQFGRELRSRQPDAWIVTSIDARPWEIDRIPIAEFATFTTEIAPQVYWSAFQTAPNVVKFVSAGYSPGENGVTPRFVLDAAFDKLRAFGLPVRPIGDGTRADESEWGDFIEHAYANDAEAVSVWRFGVTDSSVWRLLKDNPPRPLTYTVQAGDSLGALATQWRTSVVAISEINGIANPNLIRIGTVLRVPRGATVARQPILYTVQRGDTLSGIAGRFDTTASAIADLNGIADPNLLRVGDELSIPRGTALPPPPILYTVRAGDTLGGIASRFDTTAAVIADLNGVSNPNLLRVGQELRIPRGVGLSRPPVLYTVQPGDTLADLAKRFNSTVEAIAELNGITRPNLIAVGTQLRIP